MARDQKPGPWKAITLDWVALLDYDHTEQIAVCMTQRQIAILKALLTTAYWPTRWPGLPVEKDVLEQFVSEIDYKLDGNDCEGEALLFRDNPLDPCDVQYSTNGGVTWTTAFRKDNCLPATSPDRITNIYIDIDTVTTNNTTYAGDIINVAPGWEYTDPDQKNSLCWVIHFYVDMICDFAIRQIESNNADIRDNNDFLFDLTDVFAAALVTGIVSLSAVIAGVTFPPILVGAAVYAASHYAEEFWDGLLGDSTEAFEDETARQTIKCMMYNSMEGQTPQFDLWSTSVDFWEQLGGNYKAIAEQVHILNQSVDTYINYMMMMEDINNVGDSLPPCPCPETWSHVWNFRTHGKEAWQLLDLNPPFPTCGYWDAGNGFVARPDIHPGKNQMSYATLDEPVPRVNFMKITYDCEKGYWDGNEKAVEILLQGVGAEDWTQAFISTQNGQTKEMTKVIGDATQAYAWLRSSWDEDSPYDLGSMVLWKVEFRGEGVDPFSGRVTS